MSFTIPGILLTIAMMCFINHCEGNVCPRTNLDPNRKCVSECSLRIGCYLKTEECLCDGDCGYSCIKKGFRCATPLPKRLNNGQRIVNNTLFNTTAYFACNPGFKLSGSSNRKCRGRGHWDGSKPRCRKYCSDPGINQYTRRDEPKKEIGFKEKTDLHYYCFPNFQMQGHAKITCKSNGKWSNSAPNCFRPPCPPPTLPPNSRVTRPKAFDASRGAQYGTRLILSCNPGYYKVDGNPLMICAANKKWDISNSFKCSARNCGNPGAPTNGQKHGLLFNFTSNVSFTCDYCYKLVGASYRICMANGEWSDKQPICKRAECTELDGLGHGLISFSSTNCGSKAKYSCDIGYKLDGPKERRCDENGQWTGETPKCTRVYCEKPTGLTAAGLRHNATDKTFYYGSVIRFKCEPNYVRKGSEYSSCQQDGRWSNVTQCLAPCNMTAINGTESDQKEVFNDGEDLIPRCKDGYILLGQIDNKYPKCLNGTWTSEEPLYCEEKKIVNKKRNKFWKTFRVDQIRITKDG